MTLAQRLRHLTHVVIATFGAAGATRNEIEHATWRADLLAFAAAGDTLSGAAYERTAAGVGPIGAAAARNGLERDGLIRMDADRRWRAQSAPTPEALCGEGAASVEQYARTAVERLDDWPVPRRLIEALAPGTAVPAAAVFLAEPRLTAADRAATARWTASRNAMGHAAAAPPA